MVRPLFYFEDEEMQIFQQAPTDDFEGVTDFELNAISWTGPNPRRFAFGLLTIDMGPPVIINHQYEAFDLDGQLLDLAYADADAGEIYGLPVEWVLVATGRFDLPRLHELAQRYAESVGFELPDDEPLLCLVNRNGRRYTRS